LPIMVVICEKLALTSVEVRSPNAMDCMFDSGRGLFRESPGEKRVPESETFALGV
jgi:hypothetical protein